VDDGIPINFVRGTDSTGAGFSSSGLGNVYGDLRLNYKNPLLNYFTTLTGFASVADQPSTVAAAAAIALNAVTLLGMAEG